MNKKAFTIIEIMLIIVLLGAIIAVATLTFGDKIDEGQNSLFIPSHELYQNK